jgi:hypothetical protein
VIAESFFATLKIELVHQTRWRTRTETRGEIFEYIELSRTAVDAIPQLTIYFLTSSSSTIVIYWPPNPSVYVIELSPILQNES